MRNSLIATIFAGVLAAGMVAAPVARADPPCAYLLGPVSQQPHTKDARWQACTDCQQQLMNQGVMDTAPVCVGRELNPSGVGCQQAGVGCPATP